MYLVYENVQHKKMYVNDATVKSWSTNRYQYMYMDIIANGNF